MCAERKNITFDSAKISSFNDGCPLCDEFSAPQISNRLIYSGSYFNIIPSMGPLHSGHVLLCPMAHHRSMQTFCIDELKQYYKLFSLICDFYNQESLKFCFFENGTPYGANGGCSIVHSHTHFIPTLDVSAYRSVLANASNKPLTFTDLVSEIRNINYNYVLLGSKSDEFFLIDRTGLPSQQMRRLSADYIGMKAWDWRSNQCYSDIETTPILQRMSEFLRVRT